MTTEPEVPAPLSGGPEPRVRALEVRRGAQADLPAVADVLGQAFADYPWTRWCVDADDHVRRITELQRISLDVLGLPFGLVWLGERNGKVISAAVWTDSRTDVDRSRFIELADRSRSLHGNRLHAAIDAEAEGFPRPPAPHLFLETMGTHPDHRRRGHGAAVLGPGLELADREDLMCGLETSTEGNVAFYQSVGFDVVHHRVVANGGPDVWTMWRGATPSEPTDENSIRSAPS